MSKQKQTVQEFRLSENVTIETRYDEDGCDYKVLIVPCMELSLALFNDALDDYDITGPGRIHLQQELLKIHRTDMLRYAFNE